MKKLTKTDICNLPAGEVGSYFVRLTRLYYPNPIIVWEGNSILYVQKRTGKNANKHGPIVAITPRAYNWAEVGSQDIEDSGDCVVEDYLMEIFDDHQ